MIQISNSDFFLFLHPWSVPFIMNQPNICFYMFIICIFMRGQFWTLEHSPSHCSRVQFWTRTISPADSPPFQFGNTSHWSLDSYQPQWTLLNPRPPPTTSQGGAGPPPPRRLINYRKSMFLCRKNLQFVPHIPLVEGEGGNEILHAEFHPPPTGHVQLRPTSSQLQ